MDENQLATAFGCLSIVDLARELGIELKEGAGQKSPFRLDKSAGSFSVQRAFFKDHANDDHKGGHIKFVELARPTWSKKDCIEFIIRAAGMEPVRQKPGTVKRVMNEKRANLYRKAQQAAADLPALGTVEPPAWNSDVHGRWNDGQAAILEHINRLAESRGWSSKAMRALIGANKTSLPLLPWADAGNRRGWAWLIEKPIFSQSKDSLVPVGFHARFKIHNRQTETIEKRWIYCPYIPSSAPRSQFQKKLLSAKIKLPAYPFVLGDLNAPKLVIILEGQFDAISFALAFGWDATPPPGIVVFGLRGVSSPGVFLAAYGRWLAKHHPFLWVIGDNDTAGHKIALRKNDDKITAEPSFIDRLRAQGCSVYPEAIRHPNCKDFNDVYKASPPPVATMRKWAQHVGAGDLIP